MLRLRPFLLLVGLLGISAPARTQPLIELRSQVSAEAAPTAHPPPEDLTQRAFRLTQKGLYDRLIYGAAAQWRLDPFLLKGLLYVESRLSPRRTNSRSGAAGIAQFTAGGRRAITNLRRHRGVRVTFTRAQALDPTYAIPAAAELIRHLLDLHHNPTRALLRYNGGNRDGSHHFVYEVHKHTNRLRTQAGLPPLPPPVFPRSNRKRTPLPVS